MNVDTLLAQFPDVIFWFTVHFASQSAKPKVSSAYISTRSAVCKRDVSSLVCKRRGGKCTSLLFKLGRGISTVKEKERERQKTKQTNLFLYALGCVEHICATVDNVGRRHRLLIVRVNFTNGKWMLKLSPRRRAIYMRADGGGRVRVRIAMILRLSVSGQVQNLPRHVRIKATVSGYCAFHGIFPILESPSSGSCFVFPLSVLWC